MKKSAKSTSEKGSKKVVPAKTKSDKSKQTEEIVKVGKDSSMMPGQKYATPEDGDGTRLFYESLF